MSDQKGLCALCGIQATLMCQRCFECYCSVNCQIEDWAKHKLICIPMPTLIPLQPMKPKKVSVNTRLERLHFQNNSPEPSRLVSRNIPLRKPQWYNQSDGHSGSEIAIASNFRKIDQSDIPKMAEHDNNSKNEGPFTSNGKSNDSSLKLRNENSKDDSISSIIEEMLEEFDDAFRSNTSEKNNRSTKPWKKHFPTPKDKFFKAIVQYVSECDPKLVWVMDASYEAACTALLKETNKNITNETKPCSEEVVYIGNVVVAPFFGLYYRAIILEEKNPLNEVRVRLLDYGNDFYININKLKSPITAMKNLNSYAFCIRYNGKAVDIGDIIKIKIIDNEYKDVYEVEEEEDKKKEELPINMKIKIVNVFNKIYAIAIVQQNKIADQLSKMKQVLATDTDNNFELALPPVEGSFIAGKTSTQWERGFLLSSYESHYIMYCVDIGEIELLSEVKSVPKDFKNIPRQALLITFEKEAHLEKYWDDGSTLELKPITNDSTTNYELYFNANKLAGNVKVSKDWNGYFADIYIEYWSAGPKPNDEVRITHIHSHCEISVCKHDKGEIYSKIFDQKGRKAAKTDAVKNKIVLAFNQSRFVRCKVLDKLPQEALLLDLDSGNSFKAKEQEIRESDNFVRYAPVFIIKAILLHLNKINPYPLNKAVASLKSCVKERNKFTISFLKNEIELFIDANTSYNKQLIPLLFEEITNGEQNNNNKEEKAQEVQNAVKEEVQKDVTSKKMFVLSDIEQIPIPTGQSVKIIVLDNSMIETGLITACDFNPDLVTKFQTEYAENIMKYCTDPSIPQEYSPRASELCFSIFEDDNQWYRAVCLSKCSEDNFLMLFVDYGNTSMRTKKDLRKITKDFIYPTLANTCTVEGLPEVIPEKLLKSIKSIIYPDAVLKVDNVRKTENSCIITIDKITKLLP